MGKIITLAALTAVFVVLAVIDTIKKIKEKKEAERLLQNSTSLQQSRGAAEK